MDSFIERCEKYALDERRAMRLNIALTVLNIGLGGALQAAGKLGIPNIMLGAVFAVFAVLQWRNAKRWERVADAAR